MRARPAQFLLIAVSFLPQLAAQTKPQPADAIVETPQTPAEHSRALLTDTLAPTQHSDNRVLALAALGSMSTNATAGKLISDSCTDKDLDVRTAAALAAGQTKNPRLIQDLHKMLDDAEPQVAYTAAVVLWKLKDHSGEDLLAAVSSGDRAAGPGLFKGARHKAAHLLHNPSLIGIWGAEQGAGMLLGPFGFGVTAVEYARKNGGNAARAGAIELLAEEHTAPVHQEFLNALGDKDPAVRASAARALGNWPDAATAKALEPLLDDSKLPVKLAAAASYLRITEGSPARATAKPKSK